MDEGRKLTYVRIYSGAIKVGDEVYNVNLGKKESYRESSGCTQTTGTGLKRLIPGHCGHCRP